MHTLNTDNDVTSHDAKNKKSTVPTDVQKFYKFPIIGIGASAGGLEALRLLFRDTDGLEGISFIVVTHLDPTRKSLLAELLQKQSRFTVREAKDLETIQPNHVHVIPPNSVLTLSEGRFHLALPILPRGFRDPINSLFSSLAAELKDRSLGIVLSGTGTDGVHGAEQIKAVNGRVFIQDPTEAAFQGMPQSIASLGLADETASISDLSKCILRWKEKHWGGTGNEPLPPASPVISSRNADRVIALLHEETGHDFGSYRRGTLLRRLKARLERTKVDSIAKYITILESSAEERRSLVDELLINLTSFFRDPLAFQFIREHVFPELIERVDASTRHLRVWVPGCASGEEAYSLAILFFEEMERLKKNVRIHIFATDIDEDALEKARDGHYKPEQVSCLTPLQLQKYFVRMDDGYRVSRKLRDVIVFAKHDLLRDAPLPKMLMVSCRNVFIYFDRPVQERIINSSFQFSLVEGGILFLGTTESVSGQSGAWDTLSPSYSVYRHQKKNGGLSGLSIPQTTLPRNFNFFRNRADSALGKRQSMHVQQTVYEEILRVASPALFVVDSENNVIFCSEKAKFFIRIGLGLMEHRLENIIRPEVRWEVSHLLRSLRNSESNSLSMNAVRVASEDSEIQYFDLEAVKLRLNSGAQTIAVTALPSSVTNLNADTAILEKAVSSNELAERNQLLEAEMVRLRTSQTATISELESLNAELVSSNEEFGTLNEELQAATEELETNREELQSINEELQSVNSELTLKVKQLSDSNDDLYNLLSCNDFSILLLDSDLNVKRFTVQAGQLLSLRESDIGRKISEFNHLFPFDMRKLCTEVVQTGKPVEREIQITVGNWFNVRIMPYLSSERGSDGLVITLVNITEIKSYREALSRFQGRSKALVDSLPGNLLLCDENGVVQYSKCSRSAFRLFDPDTATGKRLDELGYSEININPDTLKEIARLAKQTFIDKTEQALELSAQIPRGPSLWFDVRCVACGTEGVLIFFHEITERKRLELELNRAVQAAELSNRAKTDFIANVSHELRTPLNSVIGFAQLLNRGGESLDATTFSDYVRRIEESGRILLHLVNELLDLAQIDSGKLEIQLSRTSINSVVKDCVALMAHQFGEQGQVCSLELPVLPTEVFADEKRLKQVIINVLSNASKFSPPRSKVKISVKISRQDKLTIEIADSGPGVPTDKLDSIFDRFARHVQSSPAAAVPSGTGLGLAISKSIIEAHGGKIIAKTPGLDNKGLTIAIHLPMRTV